MIEIELIPRKNFDIPGKILYNKKCVSIVYWFVRCVRIVNCFVICNSIVNCFVRTFQFKLMSFISTFVFSGASELAVVGGSLGFPNISVTKSLSIEQREVSRSGAFKI